MKNTEDKLESVRIAAIQFPLAEGQSFVFFLEKLLVYIKEAQQNGAQIVVFPELITTELVDWKKPNDKEQMINIAEKFAPEYIAWLRTQAQKMQISILGGTTPRLVDGQIFNTAILALPDGNAILQDKIFLTPDEKKWGWSPGTDFKIFHTPWGKAAITICFDCEFPLISQMLSQAQPEVIFVPSWTSSESGLNRVDWTAKSRAIEHFSFVIKTGTVPDKKSSQLHYGKASIITPQDQGFPTRPVEGELNKPAIIYEDLNLKLLRERRKSTGYYPDKEQQDRKNTLQLIDEPLPHNLVLAE